MVLPILPLLGAGIGAAVIGGSAGAMMSGKKGSLISTEHAPYEYYAPTKSLQYAPITTIQYPDYQVMVESPGAEQTLKKTQDITSDPSMETAGSVQQQFPFIEVALIGGVAYVIVAALSKKKGAKK